MPKLPVITFILVLFYVTTVAQKHLDSTLTNLQQFPMKFLSGIDKKVNKYTNRITGKTEKTLTKLCRWENKIKILLQKANPSVAERLFSNNQLTFTAMLQKLKEGEAITNQYRTQYDGYRDKLTTDLKYLQTQKENINIKLIQPLDNATKKMQLLNEDEDKSAAIQQFIIERKKQLISESVHYIGQSKYLLKINKESFYYVESLKNYKDIFNEPGKAEALAKDLLNKIPAFQQFVQKNSILASLFGMPENYGTAASLAGLQTRSSVQNLIQSRIGGGGPNAMRQIQENVQAAQSQLTKLKDKLMNNPQAGNGGDDLPDFKPNMEKTKTFKQRLEFGSNFQFSKSNTLMPTTTDIGLSVGYRINNKSVAGIGASYKMGMGSIDRIRFSNQGASLRSFIDWKLKKQFFISGGMEMNYLSKAIPPSPTLSAGGGGALWQQSALAGISKKISIKTKWFKETQLRLFYDFLSHQHLPVSQPVVFKNCILL